MHDEAPSAPPVTAAAPRPPRRFHAGHALILLLEYIGAQYAAGVLVAIGFGVYASLAHSGQPVAQAVQSSQALIIAYTAIIGIPLGILIVVLQTRHWARGLFSQSGARGIAWTRPVGPGLSRGAAAGIVLGGGIYLLLTRLVPPDPQALEGPLSQLAQGGLFERVVMLVLAVLIAPLIEEFLFRGAMFAAVARSWGVVAAVILTTLAFVAVHLPDKIHYWPGLVAVGLLALVNCWLRLRYRSLAPAMVAHFAYNISLVVFGAMLQ
ncbi:MAG TPA: CPBP family intramembrane glutamic endopeptidase [Gammaproteobacteria bacterium]|nr:CPBP family intramembrane glutamic endopeptidase [Gammaproteobacteria bacterium]